MYIQFSLLDFAHSGVENANELVLSTFSGGNEEEVAVSTKCRFLSASRVDFGVPGCDAITKGFCASSIFNFNFGTSWVWYRQMGVGSSQIMANVVTSLRPSGSSIPALLDLS